MKFKLTLGMLVVALKNHQTPSVVRKQTAKNVWKIRALLDEGIENESIALCLGLYFFTSNETMVIP